jgi:hypothetical protein
MLGRITEKLSFSANIAAQPRVRLSGTRVGRASPSAHHRGKPRGHITKRKAPTGLNRSEPFTLPVSKRSPISYRQSYDYFLIAIQTVFLLPS